MIENWSNMSSQQKMITLLKEMSEDYYQTRELDNIPNAIRIREVLNNSSSSLKFYWILIHSDIPYRYLNDDIPIHGMGMMGRSIAFGENKALVNYISDKIQPKYLDKIDFNYLIEDAYDQINSISVIFYPIKFYTQIHNELNIQYKNGVGIIKTYFDEIKMVHSNNYSKWNQIVILSKNSIEWSRKLSPALPPNISDYHIYSGKNEHFQSAYKITQNGAFFTIGILYNCKILKPDEIKIYCSNKNNELD